MQFKFTLKSLKSLKPHSKRDVLAWDTDLKGFGQRVTKAGVKSWVIQYTAPDGRRRRYTLGAADDRLPLSKAKSMAAKKLRDVAAGEDPAEAKQAKRQAPTMQDLKNRVLKEHASRRAESTQRMYRESFQAVNARLGKKTVESIRWEDIAQLHAALKETPYKANRVLAVLRKSFGLAKRWGWYPRDLANPAADHDRYEEKPRGQVVTSRQVAAIGRALEEEPESSQRAAFTCLLLTGCRPREILRAKREDVTANGRVLRLKESKVGPRLVFLGKPAADLIEAQAGEEGNPYVFPGTKKGKPLYELRTLWLRVKERASLPESLRLYDAVRHSFISRARGLGVEEKVAKLLAGHAPGREAHDRYLHPLAADNSLTDWGTHLTHQADKVANAIAQDLGT